MSHPVFTDACLEEALGPGAVRPPAGRRTIIRMLRPAWMEWGLTRAPWWSPYLLYGAAILGLLVWRGSGDWDGARVSWSVAAAFVALGVAEWTLFEYWLHRLAFHFPATTPTRKVVSYVLHRHHHIAPDVPDRLVATPLQSAAVIVPFVLGARAVLPGDDRWLWLGVGIAAGYLLYEFAHYTAHHRRPRTGLGRLVRRHHLAHHFKDSTRNFGISSPFWDVVFRSRGVR